MNVASPSSTSLSMSSLSPFREFSPGLLLPEAEAETQKAENKILRQKLQSKTEALVTSLNFRHWTTAMCTYSASIYCAMSIEQIDPKDTFKNGKRNPPKLKIEPVIIPLNKALFELYRAQKKDRGHLEYLDPGRFTSHAFGAFWKAHNSSWAQSSLGKSPPA